MKKNRIWLRIAGLFCLVFGLMTVQNLSVADKPKKVKVSKKQQEVYRRLKSSTR